MNETIQKTLADTLDYLIGLVHDGTRPEDARSGLRPLQDRHSDVKMHLIWEEEAYDHSIHYDALLNLPDRGTVSLSYCDDRAMPWPLRGVHRWSDADVVRVNDNVLTVDQAIACLDFIWDEARLTEQLVNICLIQEELEANPVALSDEELQINMDRFRRARKLYRADDTYRWMERRGVTQPELERIVASEAKVLKLRDRLVAGRVQDYFDAHRSDFDTACIARILLPDEASALETSLKIRADASSFFDAACQLFVASRQSPQAGSDLFAMVRRREASAEIEPLFESATGSVIGPVRHNDGYAIIRSLSFVRATLDEPTRNLIKGILFDEWLEARRQAANIEWFWGNVSRTAPLPRTDTSVNLSFAG